MVSRQFRCLMLGTMQDAECQTSLVVAVFLFLPFPGRVQPLFFWAQELASQANAAHFDSY